MVLASLWWFGVATKVLGRDKGVSMGGVEAGRDIDLRSRPGLLKLVSRPGVLRSRPGRVATSARPACARHAHAVRATWACAHDCSRRVRAVHMT